MTYKSKFGFGCMRLPTTDDNDPTSVNQELFTQMVDLYMEKGFNFFDTSYAYHDGTSETAIRKALVERYPRESFEICDKMPTWLLTNEKDNDKFVVFNMPGIKEEPNIPFYHQFAGKISECQYYFKEFMKDLYGKKVTK